VEAGIRRGLALVESCTAMPNCKVRRAELLGVLGKMEWAAGNRAGAIADLRAGMESFQSLLAEDPANSVVSAAVQEPRGYLAVALAQTSSPAEALALARKNLAMDNDVTSPGKDRERGLTNRIQMAAVLNAAGRPEEAEKELRGALDASQGWAPKDLRWSAMFVLGQTLELQKKQAEAAALRKEALRMARANAGPAVSSRIMLALSACGHAATISRWRDAPAGERAEALRSLEGCCQLDERYGVPVGALIESPPKAAELAAIRKLLGR
jgi:tetratricopeptide (TPR) repeat protein